MAAGGGGDGPSVPPQLWTPQALNLRLFKPQQDARLGIDVYNAKGSSDVKVKNVAEGSLCEAAGLRIGDVLVAIDGTAPSSSTHATQLLKSAPGGVDIIVSVERQAAAGLIEGSRDWYLAMNRANKESSQAYLVAEKQMKEAREAANRKRAALLAALFSDSATEPTPAVMDAALDVLFNSGYDVEGAAAEGRRVALRGARCSRGGLYFAWRRASRFRFGYRCAKFRAPCAWVSGR